MAGLFDDLGRRDGFARVHTRSGDDDDRRRWLERHRRLQGSVADIDCFALRAACNAQDLDGNSVGQ
jgi:hypothetical protein